MKRETARYVSECDTCRKVKADYMKPGGLLQPLSIPKWEWDDKSMDFTVRSSVYLGLSSLSKSNLSFEIYKTKSYLPLVREPPNFSYKCININSHYGLSS
jgi:hypothetical protein